MDPQIGGMALLAAMMASDPEIRSQMSGGESVASRRMPLQGGTPRLRLV
jgi:hypothetical protein